MKACDSLRGNLGASGYKERIFGMLSLKRPLKRVYTTRKDFVKAETTLQEMTTLGYGLLPTRTNLFDYTKNEHHSDYIFDIEYKGGIGEGGVFTNRFFFDSAAIADVYGVQSKLTEINSPLPDLIALFL